MKTFNPLLVVLFFLVASSATYSNDNLINNGSFENMTTDCPFNDNSIQEPFNDGCLNVPTNNPSDWSWNSALGIPERDNGNGDGACEGIFSGVFAAVYNEVTTDGPPVYHGSSIFYSYGENLEPGNYVLSFCHKADYTEDVTATITVKLATGLVNDPDPEDLIDILYQEYENQFDILPIDGIDSKFIGHSISVPIDQHGFATLPFEVMEGYEYDQIWFYGIPTGIGNAKICIDDVVLEKCEEISCSESLNLNACTQDGTTGYIALDCGAGTTYKVVSHPQEANIYHCSGQLIITNATAGNYKIEVQRPNGCKDMLEYDVIESCCHIEPECPAPTNLRCTQLFTDVFLLWDEVPGALGYELYIYGGGCGTPSSVLIKELDDNQFKVPVQHFNSSFEWAVRAICENELISDFSEVVCFDIEDCPGLSDEAIDEVKKMQTDEEEGISKIELANPGSVIYPNPNKGEFTLSLSDHLATADYVDIQIYNQTGTQLYQKMTSQSILEIDLKHIPSGIYYLNVVVKNEVYTQKLVIQ